MYFCHAAMIKYSTEIDVAGIIIRDPVTALTNVLIFATALWWFRHLQKHSGGYVHSRFWGRFALGIGSASLIGVIVHGAAGNQLYGVGRRGSCVQFAGDCTGLGEF